MEVSRRTFFGAAVALPVVASLGSAALAEEKHYVYHVANPHVRGVVVGPCEFGTAVLFDEPVTFPGHFRTDRYWECSTNLLFPSSAEAWRNKRY